jgi:hypothetical protein
LRATEQEVIDMVDLHTNEALARTRMAEDARRAAQQRLRRHVVVGGRTRLARGLAAVADRLAPPRRTADPSYDLERAA